MTDTTITKTPTFVVGKTMGLPAPILLWRLGDAPFEDLRGPSREVLDELCLDIDWVALVPGYLKDCPMPWGESLTSDHGIFVYHHCQHDLHTSSRAVKIWRWADAPAFCSKHSSHGGDEVWVAVTPPRSYNISFLRPGTPFGRKVSTHMDCGRKVHIGAR